MQIYPKISLGYLLIGWLLYYFFKDQSVSIPTNVAFTKIFICLIPCLFEKGHIVRSLTVQLYTLYILKYTCFSIHLYKQNNCAQCIVYSKITLHFSVHLKRQFKCKRQKFLWDYMLKICLVYIIQSKIKSSLVKYWFKWDWISTHCHHYHNHHYPL